MDMLGTILADEFEQMAIAMRATALQADGRANGVASAPIIGEEERTSERSPTAGGGNQPIWNFGEKDAGRNRRQLNGLMQPSPARGRPVLRVINGKDWRTHAQERLPPLGVRQSLMLIQGGKR